MWNHGLCIQHAGCCQTLRRTNRGTLSHEVPLSFNYLTKPWHRVVFANSNKCAVTKFHAFCRTIGYITILLKTYLFALPWARWLQTTPTHFSSVRYILVFSSIYDKVVHVVFHLMFAPKNLHTFLIFPFSAQSATHLLMRLLIMYFYLVPSYVLPQRSNYPAQLSFPDHPNVNYLPYCDRRSFISKQNNA